MMCQYHPKKSDENQNLSEFRAEEDTKMSRCCSISVHVADAALDCVLARSNVFTEGPGAVYTNQMFGILAVPNMQFGE